MNFADPAFLTDFSVIAMKNGTVQVSGIFDNAFGDAFGGLVDGSGPMFRCLTSAGVARNDTLVINSTTYTVNWVEPDGTGMTVCRLES